MQPVRDPKWANYQRIPSLRSFRGVRIKDVRATELRPGGRCALTLFEPGPDDQRAHPRLTTDLPAAVDPVPPLGALPQPEAAPATAAAFELWLRQAWAEVRPTLALSELGGGPEGSRRYHAHSVRSQRAARFLELAQARLEAWLAAGTLPATEASACRSAVRVLASEDTQGPWDFDDSDTGTYHSFGHDAPFVHYLEDMLAGLPEEGSKAFALLDANQQESVRRQVEQARAHLDHLMRHKYAYDGIEETDIEMTLGGLLIDRRSRRIVSEDPASAQSLQPAYELLRIEPGAAHPAAGEWIYRDGEELRLQDGTVVEVAPELLRSSPVDPAELTFQRAPDDPRRRSGIRFDWDGNGWVQPDPVEWVGWAGHCDIKAIQEALGLTLADGPEVSEYRADTGQTAIYTRDLLLEMLTSAMELGSVYQRADGSGTLMRGLHSFGGSRNDSRPDRLQFQGTQPGRSLRWPLGGRQEDFEVVGLELDGEDQDLGRIFFRRVPAPEGLDIVDNPLFLKTIEGDYNLLDVSRAVLTVKVREDVFDPATGYPSKVERTLTIDLRPEATERRSFLGTAVKDGASREVYKVYLDRSAPQHKVEALVERWVLQDGTYVAQPVPEATVVLPMAMPLTVTLSREMKRDDPDAFQALLEEAVVKGRNICADTDMAAQVWNGVVTRIEVKRQERDPATRTERWTVDLVARFGKARLDYLVKRDADGQPLYYCPVDSEDDERAWPDFLWQDFPDVASKGFVDGAWVINKAMLERGIVQTRFNTTVGGETYVFDDHIKNVYELLFCGLGGYPWTVVVANKRYGFTNERAWRRATRMCDRRRGQLSWTD